MLISTLAQGEPPQARDGGLGWALPPPPVRPDPVSAAAAFPSHWPLCLRLGICLSVSAGQSCLCPGAGGEAQAGPGIPCPLLLTARPSPYPPGALQSEPCVGLGGVSGAPRSAGGRDARGYGVLMDALGNAHRARGCPRGGQVWGTPCGCPRAVVYTHIVGVQRGQ